MRKSIIICSLLAFLFSSALLAQQPDWVSNRPLSTDKYIGIGIAELSDKDFQSKATHNALSEIAAQICVNVEGSSFIHTVDIDGHSKELFEDKIKEKVATHIEGHQLMGSFQSDSKYYIYYELDKKVYAKKREARRQKAISQGLDYYQKAQSAISSNAFTNALQLYAKGLEVIEPDLYLDLTTSFQGSSFNVPAELYSGFLNVFNGMVMTANVSEMAAEVFKPSGEPIAVCLSKNSQVLPNVMLKATFVTGDGTLTKPVKTDQSGSAVFYITNITSKQEIQEIQVSIDDSFISTLPQSYRSIIRTDNWPVAKVTVALASQNYTAYLLVDRNDLEGCQKQVSSILANNYFTLTEDTNAALFIKLSTELEVGNQIPGELYDFNECFCSLTIGIFDNFSQKQMISYNSPKVRVLVPTSKSEIQAMQMCTRELMKKVNIELPKTLKKMNLNN